MGKSEWGGGKGVCEWGGIRVGEWGGGGGGGGVEAVPLWLS